MSDYEKFIEEHEEFVKDVFSNIDLDLVRIIKIHLYCEYWINKLILAKVRTGEKIVKSNYAFAAKVDLIYNMEFISEEIYTNLRKLNDLRNGYAHNLNYKIKAKDMDYPHMSYLKELDFTKMQGIIMVFLLTYVRLYNVCVNDFGLSPDSGEL